MSISVLVADDSKLSRRSVIRSLPQDLEYDITEATNGQEAINALSESEFALVLLDLTMPEVDGVQVLERIKAEKIECFVLVISADIQQQMKQKVAQLGAIDFINKPINKSALSEVLHKFGIH